VYRRKGVEMVKHRRRPIGLFLLIALVGLCLFAPEALAKKRDKDHKKEHRKEHSRRESYNVVPPNLSLSADSAVITVCPDGGNTSSVVRLNAKASSPGGLPIRYFWSASAGKIEGDGPDVTWDLAGVAPGSYKAYVDIETGSTDAACQAFTSTTVVVNKCPERPVCPNIVISCPERIVLGQPVDFSATVTGGSTAPIYNWSVSGGTITTGQGTSSIRVDTSGQAGQSVKATLSMTGYPMDCSASCVINLPPPLECQKFDTYPNIPRNDEKARLDNFAIALQNDPTSTAYVIIYPGPRSRSGDVQRHTARVVDYLINSRGIDGHRVVTLVGTTRSELLVELWVCPQGAKPPIGQP
jgi:hypothetical protein